MSLLTKSQILKADDLQTETVSIPEWGGDVLVSEMSGHARDEFEQYMADVSRKVNNEQQKYMHLRAPLCAMCLVDNKGNRLFSMDDMEQLGKKNGLVLDRIFEVANRLNKVFGQEREDVEKNSETTPEEGQDGS